MAKQLPDTTPAALPSLVAKSPPWFCRESKRKKVHDHFFEIKVVLKVSNEKEFITMMQLWLWSFAYNVDVTMTAVIAMLGKS